MIGTKLIPFELKDHLGQMVTNKNLLGKYTVLYFYPKDNTPGCTTEACNFRDSMSEFTKLNVQVYGVSKDSAKSHENFSSKFHLNFPLIVDTEGVLIEGLGAWGKKKLYGKEYMGIMRYTFIIGPDGTVVKKYDKVDVKTHHEEVLSDLKKLLEN